MPDSQRIQQHVAHSLADLDTAFLDRVLAAGGCRVVHARCEPMGTGQMAASALVHLTWADSTAQRPDTVVAKLAPLDPSSRATGIRHGSYRREVGFYQHLAPLVHTPVPTCLHAAIDDTTGDFTLVLEKAPGAAGDQLRGCSPAQAAAMVDAAVGLHAPTWGRTDLLNAHRWLPHPDPTTLGRRGDTARACIAGFADRYSRRLAPGVLRTAEWAAQHLEAIAVAHTLPLCLVHGDFRIDNMLFTGPSDGPKGGNAVTVVDWQTVSMGRGPDDVAYALGAGLLAADRQLHEAHMVRRYVQGLQAAGVHVTHDEIEHDHRLGTANGLLMAVIASQHVVRTERGDEMFAVMAERHAAHMADQRIEELVP